MNDFVVIKNKVAMCDSLDIAQRFNKEHRNVTQSIDNLTAQNSAVKEMFKLSSYTADNGQVYRKYYMNRDGFSLLAMGFTGKEALDWKLKYINAFNQMEQQLQEHNSSHWQQTRLDSKATRRMETAALKRFVAYAKKQGSKNADRYYTSFTKLANNTVGISSNTRDGLTSKQLNNLAIAENIISKALVECMGQQMFYKDIFQECKARLQQFGNIAYI